MPTFLFDKIIFGPVQSRRLGVSLGINLLPLETKFCNFDCIYCECGRTIKGKSLKGMFHTRESVKQALRLKLSEMKQAETAPDVITFAGNGEPTTHKDFPGIIDDTIALRNEFFPQARVAVLSNATMISNQSVFDALLKVDENILKLDSAFTKTVALIDNPPSGYSISKTVEYMKLFEGKLNIQTMFVCGIHNGLNIDNTTEIEIQAWIKLLKDINPNKVMIYTIDRDTPSPGLRKVSLTKLNLIADQVRTQTGLTVQVSG